MQSLIRAILALVAALVINGEAAACTIAVVAEKASKEGGVILWKNRDSGYFRTCIRYFTTEKYAYTGVIRIKNPEAGVLCGANEVGFGIVNAYSSNLPTSDKKGPSQRSPFMRDALINCRTVDEFEEFVRNYERGGAFRTNVGVGDATGAAAIFEIWSDGYRRYDVDKMEQGYDVRSSCSFAGDMSKTERALRRYKAVCEQVSNKRKFSAEDWYNISRSYYAVGEGDILQNDNDYVDHTTAVVVRRATVGAFVVVCGKNPRMLVSMGYPAACPAIPVWVKAKEAIPECLSGKGSHNLGRRFTKAAYFKLGKLSNGRPKYLLNKPIVREALKVQTKVTFPKRMPRNIEKFNLGLDKAFRLHEKAIDEILIRAGD